VDNTVVKALVSATESKLDSLGFKKFVTKKINSALIEVLQNLSIHALPTSLSVEYAPTVELSLAGSGTVSIQAQNLVQETRAQSLSTYLEHLNALPEDGLKELYQQKLSNGEFGEKGGAGLGFINIIRKAADKKIRATFEPSIPGYVSFRLNVVI
jgi:hypothetical protein